MGRRATILAGLAMALSPPLAACADAQAYPPQPAAHTWRSLSTHAPELRPLIGAALEAIPSRAPLAGVFRAEQQFVGAGMAYRLILVLADESKWRVTVMRQGSGAPRAVQIEPVP